VLARVGAIVVADDVREAVSETGQRRREQQDEYLDDADDHDCCRSLGSRVSAGIRVRASLTFVKPAGRRGASSAALGASSCQLLPAPVAVRVPPLMSRFGVPHVRLIATSVLALAMVTVIHAFVPRAMTPLLAAGGAWAVAWLVLRARRRVSGR
jgi:hypothetical protein